MHSCTRFVPQKSLFQISSLRSAGTRKKPRAIAIEKDPGVEPLFKCVECKMLQPERHLGLRSMHADQQVIRSIHPQTIRNVPKLGELCRG